MCTQTFRAHDTKAGYESLTRSGLVKGDSLGRSMEPREMPASEDMESRVAEGLRARGEVSGEHAAAPTFCATGNERSGRLRTLAGVTV